MSQINWHGTHYKQTLIDAFSASYFRYINRVNTKYFIVIENMMFASISVCMWTNVWYNLEAVY